MKIVLADQCRVLWSTRRIGHSVELNHSPAAEINVFECLEAGRHIDASAPQLDKTIIPAAFRFLFWDALNIFDVYEQQTILVLLNGFDGVPTALHTMRDVQLEFHVTRI